MPLPPSYTIIGDTTHEQKMNKKFSAYSGKLGSGLKSLGGQRGT